MAETVCTYDEEPKPKASGPHPMPLDPNVAMFSVTERSLIVTRSSSIFRSNEQEMDCIDHLYTTGLSRTAYNVSNQIHIYTETTPQYEKGTG